MSNGGDLPPRRKVSTKIFIAKDDYNTKYTPIYYTFSQFLTHDCSYQVPGSSESKLNVLAHSKNDFSKYFMELGNAFKILLFLQDKIV